MKTTSKVIATIALATALPVAASGNTVSLRAAFPDIEVTLRATLPEAPKDRQQECRTAPAASPAGQAVAAKGWQVISEASLGDYTLVTFAANSSPGAGGVCELPDGNLAVFKGSQLTGFFWSTLTDNDFFGSLDAQREGILDLRRAAFPTVPVAEITLSADTITLQPLPKTLPGCGGTVEIPQLWLDPIGKVRESLIALGWTPMTPQAQDPISADMQAQGFPETESCSGTGENYCSYEYAQAGTKLRIISIGELGPDYQPSFTDFELTCQKATP